MNTRTFTNIFAALLISVLVAASAVYAGDVTWDITPGTVGAGDSAVTGGTGTWNTTNGNWTVDGGVSNVAWNNANNDTALFGATAGTVTLGTNITTAGMEFTSGGYTIEGAGNTITIGNNGGVRNTSIPGPSLYTSTGTTIINANIDNNGFLFTTVGGGSATLSGVISGSGGFSTYNNSNVTLSGANTYTGKTSITSDTTGGSILTVSSFNSVNGGTPPLASSSLGRPTTVANGTIDLGNSGKRASCNLIYTGPGETTDRVIDINFNDSSSQTINASGSGLLKFSSPMTSNAGTQTGALILRGTGEGEIDQNLPALGTGGLRKLDSGTWTVGGGNISQLRVEGGTLIVKGALNSATTVSVANGSSLQAGNSIIGGTVTVNGFLSPGSSPGQMNVGGLALNAITADTLMELEGTTLGTEYDNITIAADGGLTYNGDLEVVNFGTYDMDVLGVTVYDLFSFSGTTAPTGSFVNVTVNSQILSNTGGLWTGTNGPKVSYAFDQATGDLTVTSIPEPTSIALLGLAGLLALRRRRK